MYIVLTVYFPTKNRTIRIHKYELEHIITQITNKITTYPGFCFRDFKYMIIKT